jgi:hypothetical protein
MVLKKKVTPLSKKDLDRKVTDKIWRIFSSPGKSSDLEKECILTWRLTNIRRANILIGRIKRC